AFKQELDHMEPPQDPVMAAPVEELPLAKEELPQVDEGSVSVDDYTFLPSPESKTQGKTNDASPGAASTVPPSAAATETPPLRTLPDVADSARPAPKAGEVRISQTAIYHRMRRVMYPKGGKGQKRVSDEVVKQWEKGGKSRKTLEQVFQSCGYNADMGLKHDEFAMEMEMIAADCLEQDMVVEGQYVSEEGMEEWGWSRSRREAVKQANSSRDSHSKAHSKAEKREAPEPEEGLTCTREELSSDEELSGEDAEALAAEDLARSERKKVPAVTAGGMRRAAIEERGDLSDADGAKGGWKKNAQRTAWRTFHKFGIGWRVPLSTFEWTASNGEIVVLKYLAPKDLIHFLLNNTPDILLGGDFSDHDRAVHLQSFWAAYRQLHPSHKVYTTHDSDLAYTLPLLLHGDEGRGKRRTGTMIVSLETPFGLDFPSKKRKRDCGCHPSPMELNKYQAQPGYAANSLGPDALRAVQNMRTNTKGHSFLQRWPLVVIPGIVYKQNPDVAYSFHKMLAQQLKALFYEGVVGPHNHIFCCAMLGLKADMKWHTQIGGLSRSYENQGRVRDLQCCHECLGGSPGISWEDFQEFPVWEQTVHVSRPWTSDPVLLQIPFNDAAPESFYQKDPFHIGKLGTLRDVVGSCVFWCLEKGFFGMGDVPSKLITAFGAFRLYCNGVGASPALRSFSKNLFCYKSRRSFPWTNTKGSDTVLLCRWLCVQLTGFQVDPSTSSGDRAVLQLMCQTVHAALSYYDRMYLHGLFLDRQCAVALCRDGNSFMAGYCLLAQHCLGSMNLFAIKPKQHMWKHTLVEIRHQLSRGSQVVLSPLCYNCEGNEDSVGRLARLSRRLDSRGISGRVLQCFLVKAYMLHRRYRKSNASSKVVRPSKPLRPQRAKDMKCSKMRRSRGGGGKARLLCLGISRMMSLSGS
ncbi:Putative E3 ubiquitin-protein ligase HERC1, partial [Durusdinium trenchii]